MNILKKIAEYDPAIARWLEIWLYMVLIYIVTWLIQLDLAFDIKTITLIFLTPLLAVFAKKNRDLKKELEIELEKLEELNNNQ